MRFNLTGFFEIVKCKIVNVVSYFFVIYTYDDGHSRLSAWKYKFTYDQ